MANPNSGMKLSAAILFVLAWSATAYPGKHLQLEQLVAASDVIAVVDISSIENIGAIEVEVDGNTVEGDAVQGGCGSPAGYKRPLSGTADHRLLQNPRVRGLSRDSDRSANGLSQKE